MKSDQPNTTEDEAEAQRRFDAGVPMPVAPTPRKGTEMIRVTPEAIDIAIATELWEEVEHMIPNTGREAEIAVMARVIAAVRGIGRAEGRRECADGK